MTWGSNASFDLIPCPYCCNPMRDDMDAHPTTHMMECPKRPRSLYERLKEIFARTPGAASTGGEG